MVPWALQTPKPGSAPHFRDGQSHTWHRGQEVLAGLLPGPPDVESTRASSGARGRQPVSVRHPERGVSPAHAAGSEGGPGPGAATTAVLCPPGPSRLGERHMPAAPVSKWQSGSGSQASRGGGGKGWTAASSVTVTSAVLSRSRLAHFQASAPWCPLVAKPGASRSRLGPCLLPPGGLGRRETRPWEECPAHSSLLRGGQGW